MLEDLGPLFPDHASFLEKLKKWWAPEYPGVDLFLAWMSHVGMMLGHFVYPPGSNEGLGCNVKFNSKCIKPELEGLTRVLANFQQMEQKLSSFCDPEHRDAALQAIQAASRQISSSDILGDIAGVWEEWKEHEKKQKELETQQSEKEGVLKIKETEKDFLKIRQEAAAEDTKRVMQMLEDKKGELQSLQHNKENTTKDFIFRCKAAKEETKRRLQDLQEKMQEDESHSRGPLQECEEKIASLQRQSLNVDHVNINHIIFAVDNSWSMGGSRFKLATKAVEDFRAACAGSQDKNTLLCFNHVAKCLVNAAPVTTKLGDKLRAEGCTGGTSFVCAWDEIEKAVENDPKFARIFVVFLSDGSTNDLTEAAEKASNIFARAEQQKRSMITCFVHIDERGFNPDINSALEPLVKAANGGQTVIKYVEQRIELLQIVKAEHLVQAFLKLTALVNMQKCLLDVCMSMLQRQEQEYRTRQADASKALQVRLKEEAKRLEEAAKEAETKSKSGKDHVEGLFKAFEKQMEAEIVELNSALKNARKLEEDLKKQVVKCEAEHKGLLSEFEKSKPAYEEMSSALQKMTATHLSQTDRIHEKQKQLVDRFGSTNMDQLTLQLESLQRMKDQLSRNSVIEEDRCFVVQVEHRCGV